MPLDYAVLDFLVDDCESVETILMSVNHPDVGCKDLNRGKAFTAAQVVTSGRRLVTAGLITPMEFDQSARVWKKTRKSWLSPWVWFHLTEEGKRAWERSAPKKQ